MSVILSPSLLSADFTRLGDVCIQLERAGVRWLHLDVMDGRFVPNITFGAPVIRALRPLTKMFFDVHLMIERPEEHYLDFIKAGADLLVFHVEASSHPQRLLAQIREHGARAGAALNPGTDFSSCRWLLPDMDLLMLMSVNPGFSGQRFIPQSYDKIRACRQFLSQCGSEELPIEVDGGVNSENIAALAEAGADVLVSGSAFFGQEDFGIALRNFDAAARPHPRSAALARALSWRHCQKI